MLHAPYMRDIDYPFILLPIISQKTQDLVSAQIQSFEDLNKVINKHVSMNTSLSILGIFRNVRSFLNSLLTLRESDALEPCFC